MSDTPPPPPPEPGPPPAASEPTPPAAGYTAQPAATPYGAPGGPAAKAPVLSIISLIAGILGFLGAWIAFFPIVGIMAWPVPIAAIILGFLGKRKEPQAAKGLWLTGIILGFVSLAICLFGLIFWVIAFASADWGSINY